MDWKFIKKAYKIYPSLKWMIGLTAIASLGSVILSFYSSPKIAIITIFLSIIGMYILYIFSKNSLNDKNGRNAKVAYFWMWMITGVSAFFLLLTMSAFTLEKPCPWIHFIELNNTKCDKKSQNINTSLSPSSKLEKFQVKIKSISHENLKEVDFYTDENCFNKIKSKYDKNRKEYFIFQQIKNSKILFAKQEAYLCQDFEILKTNLIKDEPIILHLDCALSVNQKSNECKWKNEL